MQFITTDQRIAVENFEVGVVYTVAFTSGDSFTGSCMGIGVDFVAFQRTAPEYIFCLTMTTAADVASIESLSDIGKILAYTGSVPVSIKTDGSPLLDYLITGNTIQNGTPTPDNPIMPQGTGERTANLSNVSDYTNDNTDTRTYFALRILMSKNGGQTETFSSSMQGTGEKSFTFTLTAEADTMRIVHNGSQRNLFIEELAGEFSGTYTYSFNLESNDPTTIGGLVLNDIMLNSGGTAFPYEPYGYKIPISSAGQTTPVYLGDVQTTRRVKKLVLDGTETITEESANVYSIPINDTVTAETGLSTHFEYDSTVLAGQFRIEAGKAVFGYNDTLANFSTFLAAQYAAGTPVAVWYVLTTEETAVVNEPLMCIGDYADTLSYRQSGVNIPTTDGLNIFDIDTTVKPSEVYLKYFNPLF